MNRFCSITRRLRVCLVAMGTILAACAVVAIAADDSAAPAKKKKLTGQELYQIHCNRCHAERYPTERTAAQWKTLLMHMRVRANLPAEQAKALLKYLQEESGAN
ncbi:MAG: hypothetical protein NT105_15695 [Verrucomicrobia bacterium]|nr:hypothetical protein [Verrucomicrobiota bacterium]